MAAKKRGLGRGLDALLGANNALGTDQPNAQQIDASSGTEKEEGNLSRELPVELIQRGKYQPRRDMDLEALQELADSIRVQGVMQPIIVRPISDKKYEIIAGERRWRATQLAGLEAIPVMIRDVPDETAIAMALIENIQREDLNPIEEAVSMQRLQQEFELTQQEVATAVGKSRWVERSTATRTSPQIKSRRSTAFTSRAISSTARATRCTSRIRISSPAT